MSTCRYMSGILACNVMTGAWSLRLTDGYHKVSLSVQKENFATGMYLKAGFEIWKEMPEEYIMTCDLVSIGRVKSN